jgi:hypothetical protein
MGNLQCTAWKARKDMLRQALDPAVVRYLSRLHDAGIIDTAQLVGLDSGRLKQDGIDRWMEIAQRLDQLSVGRLR